MIAAVEYKRGKFTFLAGQNIGDERRPRRHNETQQHRGQNDFEHIQSIGGAAGLRAKARSPAEQQAG